ncbi:MAG: ECF transporter S component [Eubacterium sp.]|nr:ECF transporter S component [Eubacterium sp.]
MLSALAFILMYLEFPLPIMPSFIKLDFSDLPALIGAFAYGPIAGVLIELIKNVLHMFVSQSGAVGELSNFMLGALFVLPAGIIYKRKKNKKSAIIGALAGAVISALASIPSNYFIVYPVYTAFMPMDAIIGMYQAIRPSTSSLLEALIVFNAPFTFCKELISVIITVVIYKPLSPILKGIN